MVLMRPLPKLFFTFFACYPRLLRLLKIEKVYINQIIKHLNTVLIDIKLWKDDLKTIVLRTEVFPAFPAFLLTNKDGCYNQT